MKIGIRQRLFFAILTAAVLAVISMFLVMQWSIASGFLRYINTLDQKTMTKLANKLEQHYAVHNNWDSLKQNPEKWRSIVAASMPEDMAPQPMPGMMQPHPPPPPRHPPNQEAGHGDDNRRGPRLMPEAQQDGFMPPPPPEPKGFEHDGPNSRMLPLPPHQHHVMERIVLLDQDKNQIAGTARRFSGLELKELYRQGVLIGYLGLEPRKDVSDAQQLRFLREQSLALYVVVLTVVILAGILSLPLATRLIRPLREMAKAANLMAAGNYSTRVAYNYHDEIGQLAINFNALATTLEKNEQARRQWAADISHELRTPISVLRAEIEAMQDGVRPFEPESLCSLHSEVLRISRLVDDLYQLSLSDLGALSYKKEEVDVTSLLQDILNLYRNDFIQAEIRLLDQLDHHAAISGDTGRLQQLFSNLLENSLKYTEKGGKLVVSMDVSDMNVIIHFQDSAPGVSMEEADRLFERLYRVESSRNRASGGAGLGLAICKNIVEAHMGNISALPSPLGGLWIKISLPLTV